MSAAANAPANPLSGAREAARPSLLHRLVSRAAARNLSAFVVPGPEIARARGLDLGAAGLRVASSPRHANALLIVGGLPEGLREAAAVAYAQMPRPRAVLAVGAGDVSPLPGPDVSAGAEQGALRSGAAELRRLFAEGSFDPEAEGFEAAVLRSRTEYTCSMHPEVVRDEPGTCPECGMELVPREAAEGKEGGDAERDHEGPGEHGAENGEGRETESQGHGADGADHGDHEDTDHQGSEPGGDFMSMVEMTQGTPRSSDGLQMEWVEAPFGPLFPGLPGGLSLTFTLDGDTVAGTEAGSVVDAREDPGGSVEAFVERFAGLDPLSPFSRRLLALRAVEAAAGVGVNGGVVAARVGALERERAASHLNWSAGFGLLLGYPWLARRAQELQLAVLRADADRVDGIRAEVQRLARRVERTPLLRRKLAGIGELTAPADADGPVARADGQETDARAEEDVYRSLGFGPVVGEGGDALARLRVRLAEAEQSLELVRRTGEIPAPGTVPGVGASGSGAATVETPRGAATLRVTLENGEVAGVELETPSAKHMRLVGAVTDQQEVADALVGIASLDLSPWGIGGWAVR